METEVVSLFFLALPLPVVGLEALIAVGCSSLSQRATP